MVDHLANANRTASGVVDDISNKTSYASMDNMTALPASSTEELSTGTASTYNRWTRDGSIGLAGLVSGLVFGLATLLEWKCKKLTKVFVRLWTEARRACGHHRIG